MRARENACEGRGAERKSLSGVLQNMSGRRHKTMKIGGARSATQLRAMPPRNNVDAGSGHPTSCTCMHEGKIVKLKPTAIV